MSNNSRTRMFWTLLAAVPVVLIPGAPAARQAATDSTALFDRNPVVREEAVRALGSRGDSALEDLLRAVFDENPRVRGAAIETLTDVGSDCAVEVLAAAVHDREARLREDVVYAARRIGGRAATSVVEMLLADPSEAVRDAARLVLDRVRAAPPATLRNSTRNSAGQKPRKQGLREADPAAGAREHDGRPPGRNCRGSGD